jgi:hypothetical protein
LSRGLFIKIAGAQLYLFGLLYFVAPLPALFLFFLQTTGAGYSWLQQGGPMFTVYLLPGNVPFGIIAALAATAIIWTRPRAYWTKEKSLRGSYPGSQGRGPSERLL